MGSLRSPRAAGAAARYARTPPQRKAAPRASSALAMVLKRPCGKGLRNSERLAPGLSAPSASWSAAGGGGPRSLEARALPGRRQKPPGRAGCMVPLVAAGPSRTWLSMPLCPAGTAPRAWEWTARARSSRFAAPPKCAGAWQALMVGVLSHRPGPRYALKPGRPIS